MASSRDQSLDVFEQQVLIDFFADANYPWHARLLLARLDGQASWIVATPDHDVEALNLATHRVIPLARDAPVPSRVAGQCYLFDPVTEAEMRTMRMEAAALAQVLGGVGAPVPDGVLDSVWIVADTSRETFGTEVPVVHLRNPNNLRNEGSVGICCIATEWTHVERVLRSDLDEWKESKRLGPGRDPRLSGNERDGQGRRFADLATAMTELRADPQSDWVFKGPRACVEVLDGIRASGQSVLGFQEFWITASGCIGGSPAAHHHRNLLSILFLALCVDQLNCYNLMCIEMVCRLILQIHKAVKRSPKNPNFDGLAMVTAHRLDQQGGALVGDFATYVAEQQKNEAFTLKQQRLFAEEVASETRKVGDHERGGGGASSSSKGKNGERNNPSKTGEGSK